MSSMRSASSSTSTCSAGEVDVALFHQIDQPARRGHDQVDAAAQRLDLRAFADAAEDRRVAQRQMPAVGADVLFDLRDQLARRRDHQHAHACAVGRRRGQPFEQRQHERRRLAGAGLRDADDVAAGEDHGNRLRLDRRRLDVAFFLERLRELRTEAERRERQLRT